VVILLALLAAPVAIELELAGGVAHTQETPASSSSYPLAAPALQARAAIDLWKTVSFDARSLAILGGEAPANYDTDTATFKAVAGLAAIRLHSSAYPQVWFEGGLGFGHLISLQQSPSSERAPLRGHAGLAALLGTGVRLAVRNWRLGAELSWVNWTNVEFRDDWSGSTRSGLSTQALLLMFSVGYSLSP
jgi:hypothetical protein